MSNIKKPVSRIMNLLKLERNEITAIYFYAILNGMIQLSLPIGVQAIVGYVLGASMWASLVVLITLVVLGVLIAGIMQVNQMKIIEKITAVKNQIHGNHKCAEVGGRVTCLINIFLTFKN